jgi:hypothetical protein
MLRAIYAVCHKQAFMLNVVMLNVVMLNVVMLNVIMLSVIMLCVLAPKSFITLTGTNSLIFLFEKMLMMPRGYDFSSFNSWLRIQKNLLQIFLKLLLQLCCFIA